MIEAKPGVRFTVRDEPINRDNAFWAPLIGRAGTVVGVMGDSLLDVTVITKTGEACFIEGVKTDRLSLFAATEKPPTSSLLSRLAFWRRRE